jgi:hypothetical protein
MEHKKLIAGLLVAVAGAVLRGPETECLTNPWGVPCAAWLTFTSSTSVAPSRSAPCAVPEPAGGPDLLL